MAGYDYQPYQPNFVVYCYNTDAVCKMNNSIPLNQRPKSAK